MKSPPFIFSVEPQCFKSSLICPCAVFLHFLKISLLAYKLEGSTKEMTNISECFNTQITTNRQTAVSKY